MIDLACLAQRLRARGVTLWLAHPQPNIRTLIETVGPAPAARRPHRRPQSPPSPRRRSVQRATMPLLLVLLFIVVPIAELALLIQVGQADRRVVDDRCC